MAQLKDSRVHGNLAIDSSLTAVDVTISGNLIIRGTTTTVDTTTTQIEDSVIELGGGPDGNLLIGDDGFDRGVLLHYYDGSAKNAFIGYKDGQIVLSANSTYSNNDVTLGATNALKGNIVGGYFVGNGDYLTNLTGSEVTGTVALANYATYSGTVLTNAQPNITSVGTLTTLTIGNATANSSFGNGTILTTGLANLYQLVVQNGANITGDLNVVGGNITGNINANIAAKGNDTQVQFNDGGQQNATSGLTFTKSNSGLYVYGEVNAGSFYSLGGAEIGTTANVGNLVTLGYANIATGNIGNLTVTGTAEIAGTANVGNLKTLGYVTSAANITGANLVSNLDVSTVTLSASGNVSTQANLVASGWANITLTANVGNLETAGNIFATGYANVNQLFSRTHANVTGYANVGNLVTGGFVNAIGNVVGDNLVANTLADIGNLKVQAGGTVTGDLIPSLHETYNLGNSSYAWKDLWLSGTSIKLGTQTISSNTQGVTQSNTIFATDIAASGNIVGNSIYARIELKGANVFANNLTSTRVTFAGTEGKLVDDANMTFATDTLSVTGNVNGTKSVVGGNVYSNNLSNTRLVFSDADHKLVDDVKLTFNGTTFTVDAIANVTGNLTAANITTGGNLVANDVTANGNIITNNISARTTGDITISGGSANGNVILAPQGNGTISASNFRITNIASPDASTDAATKGYVDANSQGLDIKASVRLATSGDRALSGLTAVDGVTPVDGDRILVKSQTLGTENGIYIADAGAWTRATDAVQDSITGGSFTFVEEGTNYADTGWVVSTNNPITIGSTSIIWTQFSSAGTVSVNVALSKVGNEINVKFDTTTLAVNGTNELKVADSAAFVTPNIGSATGTSLNLSTGNITAGNAVIGTGSGGSITGANLVSATYFTGTLTTASQPNITSVGNLTSLTVTADINANGNIRISNTPGAANGIFSDNYYYANGAAIDFQTAAGNSGEIQFKSASGDNLAASGNLSFDTSGNTLTTDNLGLYGTANVNDAVVRTLTDTYIPFANAGHALVGSSSLTFSSINNELKVTNANVTTTLKAGNIIDDHLTAGRITFAGVSKELADSANLVFDTTGKELQVDNANVAGDTKTGNITVSALSTTGGIPYSVSGKLTNISTLYYETTSKQVYMPNANVTGAVYASTTITAVGNVDGGNITTGGAIDATGNISGGNISGTYVVGTLTTASQPNITSVGTLAGVTVNGVANLGPVGNVYISGGAAGQYLKTDGSGNLSFGTVNQDQIANGTSNVSIPAINGNINLVAGGSQVITVTGTGANVTGYVDVTGDINANNITAGNVLTVGALAVSAVDSTSSITGTLKVTGGIAATGNIYTGKSVGFADNNGGTTSKAYIQFNSTSNSLDFIFN
jgi:hypothetical protein